MKRSCLILLVSVLLLLLFIPTMVSAAGDPTDTCYVVFDDDGLTMHLYATAPQGVGTVYTHTFGTTFNYTSAPNVTKVIIEENIKPSTLTHAFSSMKKLTTIEGLDKLDTSAVTDMSYMFYNCSALQSADVSGFDTANVTNMSYMFYNCSALQSVDVSGFDTSKATNMSYMFYYCTALQTLDVSGFDTTNVTSMNYMFYCCKLLKTLDVSGFDTTNVTNMSGMFYICSGLTELDVSKFNTSKVTNMSAMFGLCGSLTSLDVTGFDTANVTSMSSMFSDCTGLTSLDVSKFKTSKVTTMSGMFSYCTGLTSLNVSNFDTSNVTNMSDMFNKCNKLTTLDLSNFKTSKVTNMAEMFLNCTSLKSLNVSSFDTSKVTTMSAMFDWCYNLTSLDVSNFNTANVTNMYYMFNDCSALQSLDLSNFNTAKVTNMSNMLALCSGLKTLDLSSFDMTKVTNASAMINNSSALTYLKTPKNCSITNITLPSRGGSNTFSLETDPSVTYTTMPTGESTSLSLIRGSYYKITIVPSENGTVTSNYDYAKNESVTLTATPADGYELKSLTVKKTASGDAVTVSGGKFTMPQAAVTVTAEFAKHTHSFSYTAADNVLNAKCTTASCVYYSTPLTLTLTAPANLVYDGQPKAVVFGSGETASWELVDLIVPSIEYTAADGSTVPAGGPVDAGDYTASITAGGKTATLSFTVTKAATDTISKPTANAITYTQPLASSTFKGGAFTVGGTLSWTDGTVVPAVSDSNSTQYEVIFTPTDANYETVSLKLKLTVNPKEITVASGITAEDRGYVKDMVTVTLNTASAVLEGKLDTDDLTVTATGTMADDKVGTDKTVTISDLTLGGADAANYILASSGHQTETTVNISADMSAIILAPEANSLTYTGADQELVSEGTAENGTVYYVLGTDGTTAPDTGWSTEIPTAVEVDEYYVWYKSVGDPNYKDTTPCVVKVEIREIPIEKITADKDSYTLEEGATGSVKVTVEPADATETLTYESSDPGVVKVDEKGNITAVGAGTAKITVKSASGKATTEVTITVKGASTPKTVTYNGDDVRYSGADGGMLTLEAAVGDIVVFKVDPVDATAKIKSVTATTDGGKDIEVLTMSTMEGVSYRFEMPDDNVTVTAVIEGDDDILITKITADPTSLSLKTGDTATVKATVEPSNATESIAWESSDTSIVTVDENGKVTAVGIGTAKITVKSASGKVTAEVTATVDPIIYTMIKGSNQTFLQNAPEATFASEADYSKFLYAEVDGKKLGSGDYDSYSGSTVIVLKANFIKTLAVGTHTLKIVSTDGYATCKFTIRKVPKTGDSSMTLLWTGCLVLALGGIVMLSRKRRSDKM